MYARRRTDAPPEPDLAALAAKAEGIGEQAREHLARVAALMDAAEAGEPLPEWLGEGRLTLLLHGLRQLGASQAMTADELRRLSLEQAFGDMAAAAFEGSGFRQGVAAAAGGRHRASKASRSRRPGKDQPPLFGIPGGKTTAAAVGLAAAMAAGVSLGPVNDLARFSPAPAAHHAASSLPVLSPADAIPLQLPSQQPSYQPRHAKKPSADAATAAPLPSPVLTPPPSVPSAAPSAAPSGRIDLQTVTCVAAASGTCQITFEAVGGPVQWQASVSDPALSLDTDGGQLGDRESAVITVTVQRGTVAGAATVVISAGGQQVAVPVTWVTLPGLGL